MSVKAQDFHERAITTLIEQTQIYFEPYLKNLRLSRASIIEQNSEQLQLSLATLDTLIDHPEQLGFFRAAFSAQARLIIPEDRNKAQFEVGVLPLLLSRKQQVLDRLRELKGPHEVKTLADLVEQVPDKADREALRSELSSLEQKSSLAVQAANMGQHAGVTPRAAGSERRENPSAGAHEPGGEPGAGEYKPVDEALRAGDKAQEILGEANSELGELRNDYAAEVAQTAGLSEKLDRLSVAVEALIRTVTTLSAEARAGRDVSSLVPVAVMQKPVADGAAEDAVAAAPDGPVQKVLHKILGTLKRAAEWLWSMILHLTTVREWSLGGEVHVPGIAMANLTVTFGG